MPIPLIAALVLSLVVGGGAALGSQSSLPSDNLFGVKLFTEDVRLAVASGENEDNLRLDIMEKRAREMADVLERTESGNLNEDKAAKGLEKASENIKEHSEKISQRSEGLKRENKREEALELNEDFKGRLEAAELVLKKGESSGKEKVRESVKKTISRLDDIQSEVRGRIGEIEAEEIKELEDESSASRSAQGKIGAAENKIAETERNLERKGRKMEERSLNDSRDELDEARNLLDSAKKEFERNEFEDAFRKAQGAIRLASAINSLAGISQGKSGRISGNINEAADDMRREDGIRFSADVFSGKAAVKAETEFVSEKTEKDELAKEILSRFQLPKEKINSLLKVSNEGIEDLDDRLRVDVEVEDGISKVKAEVRFPVNSDDREKIAEETGNRLSKLTADDILALFSVKEQKNGRTKMEGQVRIDAELRGRANEPGEDVRGNAEENELRGRENEPGEDIRGNADENELRGRANEPGEDVQGNADENEVRGRDNEIEAPGDQPRQEDRTSGVNSLDDSPSNSNDGSSSGGSSSGGSSSGGDNGGSSGGSGRGGSDD